jgi:hypothetical protein
MSSLRRALRRSSPYTRNTREARRRFDRVAPYLWVTAAMHAAWLTEAIAPMQATLAMRAHPRGKGQYVPPPPGEGASTVVRPDMAPIRPKGKPVVRSSADDNRGRLDAVCRRGSGTEPDSHPGHGQ